PENVARTAAPILEAIKDDPEYPRLIAACRRYDEDWTCTAGTLTISRWDLADDAEPLLEEALRALALKAAVYRLTGDERTAEIPVARPVDEVLHAVLAQRTLTERMTARSGIQLIHMTDTETETPAYETGDYTTMCYAKTWGLEPPARYWIGAEEHARRVQLIEDRLSEVGVNDLGHRHNFTFN
ncbi:hypothetical protein E1287_07600, partial [Actinomadura sp. KC06]|uniref:hypothetical protein n=1 Tax=Actinomadura sp. KC06 TaxID=2530369 RepID=UPI00104CCD61